MEDFTSYHFVIDKNQVYKLYELEYKISQLQNKNQLSDRQYFYLNLWRSQAESLAKEVLGYLDDVLDHWYMTHEHPEEWVFPEHDFFIINEINKRLTEVEIALNQIAQAKKPEAKLEDKILAINFALHVAHSTGNMFVLGPFNYGMPGFMLSDKVEVPPKEEVLSPKETDIYLQDLSQGAFLPEWDQELRSLRAQNQNWYKIALFKEAVPYIKDIQPVIYDIGEAVKSMGHVSEVYVFGSFVNMNDINYHMKDLDIVALVDFTQQQMRQCVFGDSYIMFDEPCKDVEEFTNKYVSSFVQYNLDPWVITSDDFLLHWGSLIDEDDAFIEAKNIAWEMAHGLVPINISQYDFDHPEELTEEALEGIADELIKEELTKFKEAYDEEFDRIVDMEINEGPEGWYGFGDDLTVTDILEKGLKIA